MFDFRQQIRLKQAKNALRDGRIDEAFEIATEKEIRDLRGGQVLLERLVAPFLDRAAGHLANGRLSDALADVERAVAAGGNRPRAAGLRREIQNAMAARELARAREREQVASVRRHLQNGSLRTGLEILQEAPPDAPEASRLKREAEGLERKGREAFARAEEHLEREELPEAFSAVEEAARVWGRNENLPDLFRRLKKAALPAIARALAEGDLRKASLLLSRAPVALKESLEARRFQEALKLAEAAADALRQGKHEEGRVALGQLERIVPDASWVKECRSKLDEIARASRALKTGPLGGLPLAGASAGGGGGGGGAEAAGGGCGPSEETLVMPRMPLPEKTPEKKKNPAEGKMPPAPSRARFLLWVDGAGTYLVLTSDRISLGRLGSSAHPDIPLAGDIAGRHAEILRIEEDYFLAAAQGTVEVNGQGVRRKLLSNGDAIDLSPRCRFTFKLPTAMSATAVLALGKGQRLEGDVRTVVLLREHLLMGPQTNCHMQTSGTGEPVVLTLREGGLVCTAKEPIVVGGRPAGRETSIPFGSPVQVGDLTFAITLAPGKEG